MVCLSKTKNVALQWKILEINLTDDNKRKEIELSWKLFSLEWQRLRSLSNLRTDG